MKRTKALILGAGYGTRWLPITKAIDKCMLPVGARPLLDYNVQDCIAAGIIDIYIASGQYSEQIRAYYEPNRKLELFLRQRGKTQQLQQATYMQGRANLHFFNSEHLIGEPQGSAASIAIFVENYGGLAPDEQLVVMGADDFIYRPAGGSAIGQLIMAMQRAQTTAGMLSAKVAADQTYLYGVLQVKGDALVNIVEKPAPGQAPGKLINIGKYVFDAKLLRCVLDTINHPNPARGECDITDGLNAYISQGGRLHVLEANGQYLDGGTPQGWMHANSVVMGENK